MAYLLSNICTKNYWTRTITVTSISANADGPRDVALRKIDHIAQPTKYNYQETSVGR